MKAFITSLGGFLLAGLCSLAAASGITEVSAVAAPSLQLANVVLSLLAGVGALSGLWIGLSYAALVRPRSGSFLVRLASGFGTPAVRKSLGMIGVLSVMTAVPAAAETDLGWGADIPPASESSTTTAETGTTSDPHKPASTPIPSPTLAEPVPAPASAPVSQPPPRHVPRPAAAPAPAPAPADSTYTVRAGDTLWSIARDHLASQATTGDVAAETTRWIHSNRGIIADPDLIYPGQILQTPQDIS